MTITEVKELLKAFERTHWSEFLSSGNKTMAHYSRAATKLLDSISRIEEAE